MKKTTLKALLMAALLCSGSTGAWGENVIFTEDFAGEPYEVTFNGTSTQGIAPTVTDGALTVENGKQRGDRSAYIAFGENACMGSCHLVFDMAMTKSGTSGKFNTFAILPDATTAYNPSTANAALTVVQDGSSGNITIGDQTVGNYSKTLLTYDLMLNTVAHSAVVKVYNGKTLLKEISYETTAGGVNTMYLNFNKAYGAYKIDNISLSSLEAPNFTIAATSANVEVGKTNSDITLSDVVGNVSVESGNEAVATATYDAGTNTISIVGVSAGVTTVKVTATNDGLSISKDIEVQVGTVSRTTVTINYLNGKDLLDSRQLTELVVGSSLSEGDAEIPTILYNADKSIRYQNPSADVTFPYTVAENGVINVTYEAKAKVSSVTVNYKDGETVISTDKVSLNDLYVGDKVNIPFRYLIVNGNTVYKTTNNKDGSYYRDYVTLTENMEINKSLSVKYNSGLVVSFNDFDGSSDKNADIRASYGSSYNNTTFTSENALEAGAYKVLLRYVNIGRGSTLKLGDQEIYASSSTTSGNWTDAEVNFTTEGGEYLKWDKGGQSTTDPIDILLVIKITEIAVPVSSAGYATFVPSTNVVVPAGVTVYTGKVNVGKTSLALNPVATSTVLGAGQGFIVKADAGSYNFAVTTAEAAKLDNDLKAADAPIEVSEERNIYVLAKRESSPVGFYRVKPNTTVAAGKAYIELAAAKNAAPVLTFADATTGISEVKTAGVNTTATDFYTLQGVKVNKNTRGLLLHNGKKYLVK